MHLFKASAIAAFAALTHAQTAPTVIVKNYCTETVFITTANSTATGDSEPLVGGEAFLTSISGVGNSLAVAKTDQYWSASTAKLIFGSSVSNAVLYWAVSSVNGDPFAGESFNVDSSNACGSGAGYDGQVHACSADGVALVLSLC